MKILTNKYFILGNLLLLLISIPLTLFFISKQQELRGRAAPSSKLSFTPANPNTSTLCQNFNLDLMVDPGSNTVSIVDFYVKFDPTKLDVLQIKESEKFSTIIRPISIANGEVNMSVSIGSDVTRAAQTPSKVAAITFRPKAAGTALVDVDSQKSQIFSLAAGDETTENVLSQVFPANVNIGTATCPEAQLTPTPTTLITPTGVIQPTSAQVSPTSAQLTPTSAANTAPLCTELSVSPQATGSAPFSVLFTAKGNDPDTSGIITKAAYNFGDGKTQDVTSGLGKTVTNQTNHTYQTAGTFGATVIFTDNNGGISNACTKTITATASSSATTTPTSAPTPTGTSSGQLTITPTSITTPTLIASSSPTTIPTTPPTIAPSGSIAKTLGIIGAIILTIIGGFALLAL